MNPKLMELIQSNTPQIDPRIGDGIAYSVNEQIPAYIDNLWKTYSESFPKKLKYLGYEACNPKEGFNYLTRKNSASRKFDININDIRLYSFNFEYDGRPIKKYIYLPFVRRHGFIYLNDNKYIVTPVIADNIFTIKPEKIFAKLIKMKIWFERITVSVLIDGELEHCTMFHSAIYNKKFTGETAIKLKTSVVLYILARYGITKTLQLFGINNWKMLTKEEFVNSKDKYPKDKYVVIESLGLKPRKTWLYKYPYEPHQWLFVVKRKEFEASNSPRNVLATIMHIIDHYPNEKRINSGNVDNVNVWRTILGETILGTNEHPSVIKDTMDRHLISVEGYVDNIMQMKFKELGLGFKNIYDLFVYIINNFNVLVSEVKNIEMSSSIYGKKLSVLDFLVFKIVKAITNLYFTLRDMKTKEEKDPNFVILFDNIKKSIDSAIRTEEIMKIKKDQAELITVADPTDVPLIKMGRIATPQEKSDKIRCKNSKIGPDDPDYKLHESLVECGSFLDMSKNDPSGRNRFNLFIKLNDNYNIIPNEDIKPIIDNVARLLHSK